MAFSLNVRDERLREELAWRQPTTTKDLFKLAGRCEMMEEGRRPPGTSPVDQEAAEAQQKKKRKWEDRRVLATEKQSAPVPPVEQVAAAKAAGLWCPLHQSNDHSAPECRSLQAIVEARWRRLSEHGNTGGPGGCYN